MKKILASSLFAIFACFNAFALDWMNNGEDLSSANAQIICNGNDCTLSNINAGDITDQIHINNVTGLNSFVFADTNSNGNSTRINYTGGDYALQFSGFQGNNIELNGDVTSNGCGVQLYNVNLTGKFEFSGTNNTDKFFALVVELSSINDDFISSGHNTGFKAAIYLGNSNIYGNFISSGTNTAEDNAIVLVASTVNGDFISSGNNNVDKNWALYLEGSTVNGNFISSGHNTGFKAAIYLGNSNIYGDFISSGNNTSLAGPAIYLGNSNIYGDFISSGRNNVSSNAILVENSIIKGDFISSGQNIANNDIAINLHNSFIDGDFISSGTNSANGSAAVLIEGSTINNDVIFSGINRASNYVFSVEGNNITGDFIHQGLTVAGSVNPDNTFNATGGRAMHFDKTMLNKNFINSGTIASQTEGVYITASHIAGDIINSGNIFGTTANVSPGLYIVDSALDGKIQNEQTGIISGGYGVAMSQNYMWGPGNSYDAKNLHVINNGLIKGYGDDAIAFDITHTLGGYQGSYNNILTYSGNGKLESETSHYDIDMGAGDDVINFTDVRSKWFKINGAETININNYIVESKYTDDSNPMHTHTDNYTSVFNISNMTFLVDTENTYTTDSNLWIMENVGVLTDENLSNMTLVLQGYNNVDGYFFMDGSDLKYYLRSLGSSKIDSLAAMSPVPSISAQASSIISAQGFNRSAMNLVSGRMMKLYSYTNFKNKTPDTSGLWVQGFGEKSKYDGKIEHNTVQSVGYDSSRYGIVLGFDKQIGDNVLIGAALSYGTGEVQGELNQFNIDLKQYQLSLYGSYNINNYFIDAQVGVGTTKYDQERADVLNNALSEYNSNSISFSIGAGYVLKASDKLSITPYHRISYIKSNQDSYTDSSNLRIDAIELKSVQASFGTEIAYKLLDVSKFKWQPRAFIEYAAELGDDEIAIGSQYMDTMTIGTTGYTPDLGNNILRTGIGIMMMGSNNDYTLGLDYRYELRENYSSHGLIINGKMFF